MTLSHMQPEQLFGFGLLTLNDQVVIAHVAYFVDVRASESGWQGTTGWIAADAAQLADLWRNVYLPRLTVEDGRSLVIELTSPFGTLSGVTPLDGG